MLGGLETQLLTFPVEGVLCSGGLSLIGSLSNRSGFIFGTMSLYTLINLGLHGFFFFSSLGYVSHECHSDGCHIEGVKL